MDRVKKSHHSPYHRFGLAIFRDRMPPPPKFTDECGIEIHGVAIFLRPGNLWAVWYRTVAAGGEDNLSGRAVAFIFSYQFSSRSLPRPDSFQVVDHSPVVAAHSPRHRAVSDKAVWGQSTSRLYVQVAR